MAHRWEKEENGKYALVIDGWPSGIGSSPETGLGYLSNVSLEIPGEVSAGWPLFANTISGATMGNPIDGCVDYSVVTGLGTGNWGWSGIYTYYILDDVGQIFGSSGDGTWHFLSNITTGTDANNVGIAVWHGYIIYFRNGSVDYAATNAPTSWTTAWKSIAAGTFHRAIVAQNNDVIYFCNGTAVGSLAWNGGSAFAPGTAATYTFNAAALLLPADDQATCLSVLGTNLMTGGFTNRIYPWDRTSTTYNAPILLPETFVWRMVNANNFLYIFMGNSLSRGRIYVTSGSAVTEFFKIPDSLANSVEPYWLWGDAIWWRNYLIFSAFPFQNSGVTAILASGEIYAIKLGVSLLGSSEQNFSSILRLGSKELATVLLTNAKNTPLGGWDLFAGGTSYGNAPSAIYYTLSTASTAVNGIVFSDIIPVGTSIQPTTFSQIEFKLSTPLTSGESIQVYVRTNLSDTFVSQGTTNTTGLISPSAPFVLNTQKFQWIQIQLSLTGKTNGSHVRVTEVRIR